MTTRILFLGTGDAFCSGGRLHTAFHLTVDPPEGVSGAPFTALIDCGATTMAVMRHLRVDVPGLDAILLSHLHGDHFGGVPFVLMDACYNLPRSKPLVVAGPGGSRLRISDTLGCLYPGAPSKVEEKVPVKYAEYRDREALRVGPLSVLPVPVSHPSGATSYGLRISIGRQVVAFSGDAEWTPAIAEIAHGADLFICECYAYEAAIPHHLRYADLRRELPGLGARRVILTHPGRAMLEHLADIEHEVAEDGQEIML
jgi:ribonuclease BN (tRNA processing enzyme)